MAFALAVGPVPTLASSAGATPSPRQESGTEIAAADLIELIRNGQTVDLDAATVAGDLDLRSVEQVSRAVRCANCQFLGTILIADVVFDRVLDLGGSKVSGGIDARRATFSDAFVMGATPEQGSAIVGPSSFALARFGGQATFDGAVLLGPTTFDGARFEAEASFVGTVFASDAHFGRAIFEQDAHFGAAPRQSGEGAADTDGSGSAACPQGVTGSIGGKAVFDRASFGGAADFRQRCFVGPGTFTAATFSDSAEFAQVTFLDAASFSRSIFEGLASFRLATFSRDASFERTVASALDFEATIFEGDAVLFGLTVSGSLSLTGVFVGGSTNLEELRASDVKMDVDSVARLPGDPTQERLLVLIEQSARTRKDLSVANDAHYQLGVVASRGKSGIGRLTDLISREVGGYLVRPLHPLRAFALLIAAAALVRAMRSTKVAISSGRAFARGRRWLLAASAGLLASVRVAFNLKPPAIEIKPDDLRTYGTAAVQWAEYLAFKVLTVLFLLGLGNADPTVKQLIEAVLR